MDFNKFIENCKQKYSKHGVTAILTEVEGDNCHILLCGRNQYDDDQNVENKGASLEEMNYWHLKMNHTPMIHADIHVKMPVIEEEVFKAIDDWFERVSKIPPAIQGRSRRFASEDLKVTVSNTNCRECTAKLEDDNIYGICAECYERNHQ